MPNLEIAALSLQDILNAEAGGANSVEISHDLSVGGLTPDLDLVRRARDAAQLDIYVMLRPHARNFLYNARDIDEVLNSARLLAQSGIQGVVFGAVTAENRLDLELIAQVAQAAAPLPVTVHRALDFSHAPETALAGLVGIVPRVLTAGPAPTAWEGRQALARWVSQFGARLRFVVSGGLKLEQLPEMIAQVGAHEYHVGSAARSGDTVDVEKVRALRNACDVN